MMFSIRFTFLAIALLIAGCDSSIGSSSRAAYATKSLKELTALQVAGAGWGEAMHPWLEGKQADFGTLDHAQSELSRALEQVRTNLKSIDSPNDADSKEFDTAIQDFLDWQETVRDDFADWVEVARAENPVTAETRAKFMDYLTKLSSEEQKRQAKIYDKAEKLGVQIINR